MKHMSEHKRTAENLSRREAELIMALYDKPQTFDEICAAGFTQPLLDALWSAELVTINSQDRYYCTSRGLDVRRYLHN